MAKDLAVTLFLGILAVRKFGNHFAEDWIENEPCPDRLIKKSGSSNRSP